MYVYIDTSEGACCVSASLTPALPLVFTTRAATQVSVSHLARCLKQASALACPTHAVTMPHGSEVPHLA